MRNNSVDRSIEINENKILEEIRDKGNPEIVLGFDDLNDNDAQDGEPTILLDASTDPPIYRNVDGTPYTLVGSFKAFTEQPQLIALKPKENFLISKVDCRILGYLDVIPYQFSGTEIVVSFFEKRTLQPDDTFSSELFTINPVDDATEMIVEATNQHAITLEPNNGNFEYFVSQIDGLSIDDGKLIISPDYFRKVKILNTGFTRSTPIGLIEPTVTVKEGSSLSFFLTPRHPLLERPLEDENLVWFRDNIEISNWQEGANPFIQLTLPKAPEEFTIPLTSFDDSLVDAFFVPRNTEAKLVDRIGGVSEIIPSNNAVATLNGDEVRFFDPNVQISGNPDTVGNLLNTTAEMTTPIADSSENSLRVYLIAFDYSIQNTSAGMVIANEDGIRNASLYLDDPAHNWRTAIRYNAVSIINSNYDIVENIPNLNYCFIAVAKNNTSSGYINIYDDSGSLLNSFSHNISQNRIVSLNNFLPHGIKDLRVKRVYRISKATPFTLSEIQNEIIYQTSQTNT